MIQAQEAALATPPDPFVQRRIRSVASMHGIAPSAAEDQHFVLSSLPPSPGQKRLALGIVLGLMVALYLVTGLFGGIQLGAIHSFVAVYTTGMFVTDSITAILLYAQFSILRSRAILVIASGYLFTAFLIVPYVLAFPDVLAPNGVVGGLQTTAYLYLLWHCGFPLFVIGYTLSKDEEPEQTLCSRGGPFSDPPECRLDGGERGRASIAVHSRHSGVAAHHGRSVPLRARVALPRRCADSGALQSRARRALVSATVDSRSLLDGRIVRVLDRDTATILSGYGSLQHRLVCGARHQLAVQQYRLGCLAVRDNGAVRSAPRRCASSASRTRGALDDWRRRRGLDCSRGQAAVDRNDHERRCGLSLS